MRFHFYEETELISLGTGVVFSEGILKCFLAFNLVLMKMAKINVH